MITMAEYQRLRASLFARGFGADIDWYQSARGPISADSFAREAIFVICNSGMKAEIARSIFDRVMRALSLRNTAASVFGHKLKCRAIDRVWRDRERLFAQFSMCSTDAAKLEFLATLDHIGQITKFHLGKNFGLDVVKPDRHLVRLAAVHQTTPDILCSRLASATGDRKATVDYVLWRCCSLGLLNARGSQT